MTTARIPFSRHFQLALVAALALRLLALFVSIDPYGNPDALAFDSLAQTLREEGRLAYVDRGIPGYELRAFRSLFYPVFLAGGRLAGGDAGALALQGLIGIGLIALTGWMARRVFGDKVAVLSLWFGVFYWTSIWFERRILTEVLFSGLLIAGLAIVIRSMPREEKSPERRAFPALFAAGLLFGLATITKPAAILTGPAVVAAWWGCALFLTRDPWDRRWRRVVASAPAVALLAIGMIAVVAPAMARNVRVLGKPVLLTSGGHNFWLGNVEGMSNTEAWGIMARDLPAMGEIAMDEWFYEDLKQRRGEILARLPELAVFKIRNYITPFTTRLPVWPYRFLWPLAVLGLVLARPLSGRLYSVFLLVPFSQVTLTMLSQPWERYRYPLEPFLWPLAAAGVVAAWDGGRGRRWLLIAVVAVNLALFLREVL